MFPWHLPDHFHFPYKTKTQCSTKGKTILFLLSLLSHVSISCQVIFTLTANLKKTHTDAVALATFVDRKVC